jgi:hypothetical protein
MALRSLHREKLEVSRGSVGKNIRLFTMKEVFGTRVWGGAQRLILKGQSKPDCFVWCDPQHKQRSCERKTSRIDFSPSKDKIHCYTGETRTLKDTNRVTVNYILNFP